jgi:hypothetical protein
LFVVIGAAAILAAAGFERGFSSRAMLIAAQAGTLCFMAAATSLVVTFAGNQLGMPVQGLLLGMLFRMGLPLAGIIAFGSQRTLGATIVVVYLLALIIETILAVRMAPKAVRMAPKAVRMAPTKTRASRSGELDAADPTTRPSVAS